MPNQTLSLGFISPQSCQVAEGLPATLITLIVFPTGCSPYAAQILNLALPDVW